MRNNRIRLWSILMAIAMLIGLLSMTALADGTTFPTQENGVIKLTEDITTADSLTVESDLTIDLAGHSLQYNGTGSVFLNVKSGSLTVMDSVGGGSITVNEIYDGTSGTPLRCVQVYPDATFTLLGGKLTNTNDEFQATQVISNYGTVNIEGGVIKGVTGVFMFAPSWGNSSWTTQSATCNMSGGSIVGLPDKTYKASYGIAIYGPGVQSGDTVDNTKANLNISGGTITAAQGIGTNASGGKFAGYTLTMTGGEINGTGTDGTGMYLPAIGVNNISGGTITGAQGIRICAGELNVTGGTIIGTALSDGKDLVAGGSGGTTGAIVVGKASSGYVGNIDVNIFPNATVKNTATASDANSTRPAIVVSDKNMSNESFGYDDLEINVSIEGTVDGDLVKISNLTQTTTSDGGNTNMTISGSVTGNVFNQTSAGDITINGGTVNGNVKNTSTGSVLIKDAAVSGELSNEGTGSMTAIDSSIISADDVVMVNCKDYTTGESIQGNAGTAVATVNGRTYTSLQDAVDAAAGKTVYLLQDVVLDGANKENNDGLLTVSDDLVLDGNGFKLTAQHITVEGNGAGPSMVNVVGTADVTICNLTIDGGNTAKHGLNIYQATVAVENCKIENNRWYATVVNGSSLTVDGLTTSGNGWGINVDNKAGNASLTVNKATVTEESSLVIESSAAAGSSNTTINGGQFQAVYVRADNAAVTVNGGSFTTSMSDYADSSLKYELLSNGTYTYYKTFEEALKHAEDGAEIKEIDGSAEMFDVTIKYGNVSSDSTISVTAGTYFPLPSAPTKAGYIFLGWWSDVTKETYKANEEVRITADTTFYARWISKAGVIIGGAVGAVPSDTFFTDVPGSAWYYDAVKFVYDYDLMDGVGNNKFNPDGTLTRAMIAQVLYNLEGASGAYPSVFTDVADSAWYAKAVNWAAASGIVEGKGNNKFDPNAPITRQEMAAILYRYAVLKGYDVSKVDSLNGYTDASKVASWAKEAMGWAVENYVINGKGASRLDPTGTATRAQVAQILMNFCNNVL